MIWTNDLWTNVLALYRLTYLALCWDFYFNHLSSLGSLQPVLPYMCTYVARQTKSVKRTISGLTGTHLPKGEEKQI